MHESGPIVALNDDSQFSVWGGGGRYGVYSLLLMVWILLLICHVVAVGQQALVLDRQAMQTKHCEANHL